MTPTVAALVILRTVWGSIVDDVCVREGACVVVYVDGEGKAKWFVPISHRLNKLHNESV